METRANYVMVGGFVLLIIIGMFLAVLWLAHVQFNRQFALYEIYFNGSVTGLNVGAPVHYNGIQVGRVTDVRIDPANVEQVRVTAELQPDLVIKQDAAATLQTNLVSGVATIELTGGSRDAPPLQARPGQRYPVIASRPSEFQSVVASVPELVQRVSLITDRLAAILDERNREAIADTLDNVRKLTGAGASRADEIESLIDESAATMRDLHSTVKDADQAMGQVREILTKTNGAVDTAVVAVREYGDLGRKLNEAATHLDSILVDVRPGVKDFAQHGLSQLTSLIADARGLVASLTRVADELERNPSVFLYGDRREGYRPR